MLAGTLTPLQHFTTRLLFHAQFTECFEYENSALHLCILSVNALFALMHSKKLIFSKEMLFGTHLLCTIPLLRRGDTGRKTVQENYSDLRNLKMFDDLIHAFITFY